MFLFATEIINPHEGGSYFGLNADLGGTHRKLLVDGRVLRNGNQYQWAHNFLWGFGLFSGQRWHITSNTFFDWQYFSLDSSASITTFRIGGYLSKKISLYGVISPAIFMSEPWETVKWGKQYFQEGALNPVPPLMALGFGTGLGCHFHVTRTVSLGIKYNLQVSYYNFDFTKLLQKLNSLTPAARRLDNLSKPSTCIRQYVTFGIEFHKKDF